MKLKKNIISSILTFVFMVVCVSGILMFFHLLDDYTTFVHEFFGLIFIICSIVHIISNFNNMKCYIKQKIFIISGVGTILISFLFIVADSKHSKHDRIMIERLIHAPLNESFSILLLNYAEVEKLLKKNNIIIGDARTIGEIGIANSKPPKEIIEIIVN